LKQIIYIIVLLLYQLLAGDKIEQKISLEYWLNENLKIFSVDNAILLEIENDKIRITSNNWFGETLLNENIQYENQSFVGDNIFNKMLTERIISKEDSWIEEYNLLNNKKIKVRFLFSAQEDDLRLYRMDIREINRDDDINKINKIILNNDIIMVWTDLNKKIKKIKFVYKNNTYLISYINEK
jgi:hypothetical protein|tara:strand:- start:3404 stop:3952 length:549 start_codon:yes stop_codon:yes gene_type:complete